MRPVISIVMLNYNGRKFLDESLSTILRQRSPQPFEVLFVDNGSKDDSVAYVKQKFAKELKSQKLRILALKTNTGFTGGNNAGVKAARGEICVLVNNDVRAEPNWLVNLLKPLHDPKVAIAGCSNLPPHDTRGRTFETYYYKMHVAETMNLVLGPGIRYQGAHERKHGIVHPFYVGGVCVAFRKRDIPKPFIEEYFAYAEDVALCWEQRLQGKSLVIEPSSHLYHHGGSTTKNAPKLGSLITFHGTKNVITNYFVFYETKNIVRILPLFALTQLINLLQRPGPRLRAWWWVLTHQAYIRTLRARLQKKRTIPDAELLRLMSYKMYDTIDYTLKKSLPRKVYEHMVNAIVWIYTKILCIQTADN